MAKKKTSKSPQKSPFCKITANAGTHKSLNPIYSADRGKGRRRRACRVAAAGVRTVGAMVEVDVQASVATTNSNEVGELMEAVALSAIADQSSDYKTAPSTPSNCAAVGTFYMSASRRGLEEENEMEKSLEHWTEVGRPSSEEEFLLVANYRHFHERLVNRWFFFLDFGDRLEVGQKVAEGGQGEIFEATIDGKPHMLKVFNNNYFLPDLERQWTLTNFRGAKNDLILLILGTFFRYCSFFKAGTLLKDGSFAFVMERYWGDLRKLIDLRMEENGHQRLPFQFPIAIMLQIAKGMEVLHGLGITHRDLKASNVLLMRLPAVNEDIDKVGRALMRAENLQCFVADFECCDGSMGTRFWRAPEVVHAMRHRDSNARTILTEKIDVYSFAMTCYEILTGCIPLGHLVGSEYDAVVVRGERPLLPLYIDYRIRDLLQRCWHPDPSERPSFAQIVNELWRNTIVNDILKYCVITISFLDIPALKEE